MSSTIRYVRVFSALLALVCSAAHGQDAPPAEEDTMMVVEEGMTPEDIVRVIQLPERAAATAGERAAKGLGAANSARQDGRTFGQSMADGNRDERDSAIAGSGRETAAEIAAGARENASEIAEQARESASEAAEGARDNAAEIAESRREDARDRRRDDDARERPDPPGGG